MASVPERICIWAITPGGVTLGRRLQAGFPESDFMVSARALSDTALPPGATEMTEELKVALTRRFTAYKGHICLFSTGIAVRLLAPLITSKLEDPAVVVMDDRGYHAISLISGHLGGANALARAVARVVGAVPVITTATDVNALPSIDTAAKACDLVIENPERIKRVNMAFLRGEKVGLKDPLPCLRKALPSRLCYELGGENRDHGEETAVVVQCTDMEIAIPPATLVLRPRSLVAGMGCNRGTSEAELMALVRDAFADLSLSLKSLSGIATTAVKVDEQGLLALARSLNVPLFFYEKEALNSVENIPNPSKMVEKHLGVKSVCEAAAILASHNGTLVMPKIKRGNATLAVARKGPASL